MPVSIAKGPMVVIAPAFEVTIIQDRLGKDPKSEENPLSGCLLCGNAGFTPMNQNFKQVLPGNTCVFVACPKVRDRLSSTHVDRRKIIAHLVCTFSNITVTVLP